MSVLDTRREALDAEAVAHRVTLDGVRIAPPTTASVPAAVNFNLSPGVVVISPWKQAVAEQVDITIGALAQDFVVAAHAVAYFSPTLGAMRFIAVVGTPIAFTGSEVPPYPTDDEVRAALPADVPDDGWTLAGTLVVNHVAVATINAFLDESTRSYGVDPASALVAAITPLV